MLLPKTILTAEQQREWDAMVAKLGAQIGETPHQWAFHGTTVDIANKIAQEGFKLSWVRTKSGGGYGVYWGSLKTAAYFADSTSIWRQEMPAIIAVEISDLISAGELHPDYYMWETGSGTSDLNDPAKPPPRDWRESVEQEGAFTIVGGQHVKNLRVATLASPEFLPLVAPVPEAVHEVEEEPESLEFR